MTVGWWFMHREYRYYVYIMQSSSRRALYIGMTNNLHRRVFQHKTQESEGFTGSYDTVRLVYWESFDDVHKTIAREKQLKGWRREKKLWLIASTNPKFKASTPAERSPPHPVIPSKVEGTLCSHGARIQPAS